MLVMEEVEVTVLTPYRGRLSGEWVYLEETILLV